LSGDGSETLAVVIAHGHASAADLRRARGAVKAISAEGGFERIEVIEVTEGDGPANQRNRGIDRARELAASWILFVEPDELAHPDVLSFLAPARHAYDGLWGGMALIDGQGRAQIAKQSQMSGSDIVRHFHMVLHWWVGKSHFVRTETAAQIRFDPAKGDAWYSDYLVRIWESARCLKSAQPLTSRVEELPPLSAADRAYLLESLRLTPRSFTCRYQSESIRFAYTGRNPTLERVQLRGLFYELSDLERLAAHVKSAAVCVDVGANTGNHTLFFAKILGASMVIPIEPNPDSVTVLKQVVAWNRLAGVDTSRLGIGVGREAGQFSLEVGRRGYLGTAQLTPSPQGSISVVPLDTLITEDIDLLKIDVEMMEIDVLEGARQLILRCQPVLLVEAQDENIRALLAILENLGYRIEDVFPDQGYANYLALPKQESLG